MEINQNQIIVFDRTTNSHIVNVDGLFAGFAFTGVLQILNFGSELDYFLVMAIVILILSTVLFALRINIAMRIISCCHSAKDQNILAENTRYKMLRKIGKNIELAGIITFWTSLVPITLHFSLWLGVTTVMILLIAFSSYFFIIRTWGAINQDVPQIHQNNSSGVFV